MFKKLNTGLLILIGLFMSIVAQAADSTVYKNSVNQPMDKVYPAVYEALEEAKFYVVFEPLISQNIARFAKKWGDNYNQNKLTAIRGMVFCNGWYANQVSNMDPDMLAFCPLRLSLYEKSGITTVVFARPTVIGATSKAKPVLKEIENEVISAIQKGIENAK